MTKPKVVKCPVCKVSVRLHGSGKHARIGPHESPKKTGEHCEGYLSATQAWVKSG